MTDLITPTRQLNIGQNQQFTAPAPDFSILNQGSAKVQTGLANVNQVMNKYLQVEMAKQDALAEAQTNDELLKIKQQTNDVISQYQTLQNKDAIDALPKVQQQLDKISQQTQATISAYQPKVRNAVSMRSKQVLANADIMARDHELKQTISYRDATNKGLQQEAVDFALMNKDDPTMYQQGLDDLLRYKAEELSNQGIAENSPAWLASMRDAESELHAVNIFDDIEREKFGMARQKLNSYRDNMDQKKWLELDRRLLAKQKAAAEAASGKNKLNTLYPEVFNRAALSFWNDPQEWEYRRQTVDKVKLVPALTDSGEHFKDSETGELVYHRVPKTEEEIEAEVALLMQRDSYAHAHETAQQFKADVEELTDIDKRLTNDLNKSIIDYVNTAKANKQSLTAQGFIMSNPQMWNALVASKGGNVAEAGAELEKQLEAYEKFNPRSNAVALSAFENFLETATDDQLANLTEDTFQLKYGMYMDNQERNRAYNKLVAKQQGQLKGFINQNSRLIKNKIKERFPEVEFEIKAKDYGKLDLGIAAEQGRWIYDQVVSELRTRNITSNTDLNLAIAHITSQPSFLAKKLQHDSANEETRDNVKEWLEDQGLDREEAFVSFIFQNDQSLQELRDGGWNGLTYDEKKLAYDLYKNIFGKTFDDSIFEARKYTTLDESSIPSYNGWVSTLGYTSDEVEELNRIMLTGNGWLNE